MFRLLAAVLIVLVSPVWLVAQVATEPGTVPSVLVLPFESRGGADQWVGRGVQQDLLTDLSQGTTARVIAPADLPAAVDSVTARDAAQKVGASIVVFGQVQKAGTTLRLTVQVVDAASGKSLGNLKATGPADDLFHMEDALAGQVLSTVPKSILTPQVLQAERQAQQPAPVGAPEAPATTSAPQPGGYQYAPAASTYSDYQPPATTYSYNYYSPAPAYVYDYGAPYVVPAYTYGCPEIDLFPFCGDFGIVGGFFFGDGFRHHDFDREGRRGFDGLHGFDGHEGFHGQAGGLHGEVAAGRTASPGHGFSGPVARGAAPSSGFARSGYASPGFSRSFSPSRSRPPQSGGAFRSSPSFSGFRSSGSGFHGGGFGGGFHGGGGFSGGGFHGGGGGHAGGGHR